MKERDRRSKDIIDSQIDDLANTMSIVIGKLETRLQNLENENNIVMNHYTNLYTRVKYLEKKLLK